MEVGCQKYQKALLEQEPGIQLTALSGYMEDTIINHTSCANFWINSCQQTKTSSWPHTLSALLLSLPKAHSYAVPVGFCFFFPPSNLLGVSGTNKQKASAGESPGRWEALKIPSHPTDNLCPQVPTVSLWDLR